MNKVEITITTPAQALKDAASVWRRVEAGDEGIVPSIGFGSPSDLFAAITDRRLELLRHLASHDVGDNVANIHQLAQGRNFSRLRFPP